ncbi:zinc ABC transporter substrate-binding protein AztC [Amycolatopsis regifaucium]|uniref:ABC transporter substrate-binding protein n=1 Tax=Amycolatopsis regifaucium TaxID=546365 RepID=A0A154M3W0_9PSEU|nr:zinc ABC transporter substrate-binding protein AztC [Amycolatopsis regifaucium]KZB79301.1 ABC transporter substrate-binding protein [Amycolatopsis regifaucium]OKA07483.1 zinc ABC transporter substrate-binding protein [Amycolatopsis regifaucium]SFH10474.1 zinc/manganese transport system substrate-binding protein [Amycolatopsis regifaucium]
MSRRLLALVTAVSLALSGCSASGEGRNSVVVTTNILGDLTRNIVGEQAEVTVLMKPNADPHSFGISAQQAAQVERAGLIVYNGLGLEEGMLRTVRTAEENGVAALPVGERANPIDYAGGTKDPHFWTDPGRVRDAVKVIADEIVARVPGVDEKVIRANADRYRGEIEALDAMMTRKFGSIPAERRKLVTNHHVFGYLAQRYGFEVVGAVIPGGTTLASPSSSDLKALADVVRSAGVPVIFADSSQPDRLARVLAEQAGLRVAVRSLFSESLSEPGQGAATYLDMMRANTESITTGLTRS